MKVEWKKLMFGLAIGAGMMMVASCSDEENFDPGGSPVKKCQNQRRKRFSPCAYVPIRWPITGGSRPDNLGTIQKKQVINHVRHGAV